MAKKSKQPIKTCADCIHEIACRVWTDGRTISDAAATQCPNHETVKESSAYLCGVLDERKRKQTNADRIRAMTDGELAVVLMEACAARGLCGGCPAQNCSPKCPGESYGAWLEWLKQPAEE